jgi:FtsH-binding integral membrane protein
VNFAGRRALARRPKRTGTLWRSVRDRDVGRITFGQNEGDDIMNRPFVAQDRYVGDAVPLDAGLRRHMLGIYNQMGAGLVVTGVTALAIANTPALAGAIFGTPLKWVAMFAPLAFILFLSFRMERMSTATLRSAFVAFSAVMGVSLASIFLVFTETSIARTFFIAAGMFLSVSLWGYTTKSDLSKWTTFLFMGLIGVVIASLVNLFLASSALHFIVSVAGVIVFTGLTALDTQRAKSDYVAYAGTEHAEKLAVWSALSLYLNLVNLFQLLLTFFGQREE